MKSASGEARASLANRRLMRNSVETITAFAKDMNDFLVETESTES